MLRYAIGAMIAAGILAIIVMLGLSMMPSADDPAKNLARGAVAAFEFADPPQDPPDTPFTNAEGEEVRLADFKGKVVLVNLWATWCAPCKVEMPTLDALQAELGSEDFQVVAISMDRGGPEQARAFLERQNLDNIALYMEPTGRMLGKFAVRGLPFTFLLNREARLIGYLAGPAEWDTPEAKALVKYYIGG
ncbi:MAG: TlpA disulfide reductase family protein [Alphaproteobacteria bacterium]